jgi:LmbE family N-acetylglucosaminyl deacetylase
LHAQILIVSPHPDDDIIIAAGVAQRAVQRGEAVYVVYITNGDNGGPSIAPVREGEAVSAQAILGVPENRLMFLGYPDGYTNTIRVNFTSTGSVYTSPHGISATYATRGLGGTDYHHFRFGSAGPYNWPTMVADLSDILGSIRPAHIFTTSQWDTHPDHATAHYLTVESALNAISANPGYNPTIHKTTVWPGVETWPGPSDPQAYFTPTPRDFVSDPTQMVWSERESLDVPQSSQSALSPSNPKYSAICSHVSQGGPDRYIGNWAKKDEVFWTEQVVGSNRPPVPNAGPEQEVDEGTVVSLDATASWDPNGNSLTYQWRQVLGPTVALSSTTSSQPVFTAPTGLAVDTVLFFEMTISDGTFTSVPDGVRVIVRSAQRPATFGPNVAPQATFTASSERPASGQTAAKVADGFIDGIPGDATREWATQNETTGAWVQMNWSSPRIIGKVVLYDRPNSGDLVIAGVLSFSDGSSLAVGPLSNNATPVTYTFPARLVSSLRFTVTQVTASSSNIGLAEFQVFEAGSGNLPPTANAGPDQTVAGGQLVTLDGRGSSDPNQNPLTYNWTQTSGTAVTLSNPASATPTFTAPAAQQQSQTLRFSLVVSDGQLNSSPDTVDVTIPGTINLPPTANAGPDVSANPGASVTLNGSGSSDPEAHVLTYAWSQTGGPAVTLSSTTAVNPSFVVPTTAPNGSVLTFQLIVNDGTQSSAPDSVAVTVVTPGGTTNIAPTATVTASEENAPLQSAAKAVDGVASGYPADSSREWSTLGTNVGAWIELRWPTAHTVGLIRLHDRPNLDDNITGATLTFSSGAPVAVGPLPTNGTALDVTFPARQITWVRLTINTVSGSTWRVGLSEILVMETTSGNQPPSANAGPDQTVAGSSTVQLNGTGSSDPENATLTYSWTQTSGPAVILNGATTATPSFTAPAATAAAQLLRFQLTVSDGTQTASDTVDVVIPGTVNLVPTANAGPDANVAPGTSATLNGSGSSDPEGHALTYAWSQTAGPAVTLSSTTVVNPSFLVPTTAPNGSVLTFQLVVNDGTQSSAPDAVALTVVTPGGTTNIAPTATVTTSEENAPIQAAVKAVDGVVSGYPADSSREWSTLGTNVGAWIELRWPASHLVGQIRLHDRPNVEDNVTSGTLTFSSGAAVTVGPLPSDGTALDVQFPARQITWVRFTINTVSGSTYRAGLSEILVLETSAGGNQPPIANAGPDQTVAGSSSVQLNGTGSSDPENATLTYAWTQTGGPAVTLTGATTATPTFTAPAATASAQVLQFQLTVGDGTQTSTDSVAVTIPAAVVRTLTINDVTVTEGNTGSVNATFTVTLSSAHTETVTVDYATANGTATSGQDYTAVPVTTLTFTPGQTTRTITVAVLGDVATEPNETFFVNLTSPVNATIADAQGAGTISNDDAVSISVSINDVTVTEANTSTVNANFTVSLSAASAQTVQVTFATADNTAVAPADYTARTPTVLSFSPGATTATVTVVVAGDTRDEANETFVVNLSSPVNATIADAQGVGTINDNDATPSLRVNNVTVTEGNTGSLNATFTVTLSAASNLPVSVNYATSNTTATAGADYTAASGTLNIAVGTTTQTIVVPVLGDVLDEASETYAVNLSVPVNATIADNLGVGTITDNDPTPSLVISNASLTEPNSGSQPMVFTVTLSTVSGRTVTVNYTTVSGTALAESDYTTTSGTLTFAPGVTSLTINVPILGNTTAEPNETFIVRLSGASAASISDSQGTGTIINND